MCKAVAELPDHNQVRAREHNSAATPVLEHDFQVNPLSQSAWELLDHGSNSSSIR